MATYTPNYNLSKPEANDDFDAFCASYGDNMDKIDQNMGGGGGGGGHTIVDPDGTSMPQENKLQFTGAVNVSDDAVNGQTVVDIEGGGNVYGAFIDTSEVIKAQTIFVGSMSYTATKDCIVAIALTTQSNASALVKINGVTVQSAYIASGTNAVGLEVPLKSGQVLTVENANSSNNSAYTVFGITQGTNGIFAPVIYSDTERVIGVWTDGKPLYQKTFEYNGTYTGVDTNLPISIPNAETRFCVNSWAINANNVSIPLAYAYPNNPANDCTIFISANNSTIGIRVGSGQTLKKVVVTIQYTKTTDVAGSGNWNTDGVPTHHYSTSEQVIGTWINGKPIYEKTVNCEALPNNTTKNVAHSISDIEYVVNIQGSARNPNNGIQIPLPYVYGNTKCVQVYIDSTYIKLISTENVSVYTQSYVTLQYTKTTD